MTESAMSGQELSSSRDARYRDRRNYERFELNAPGGCLHYRGTKFPCEIIDVSISGCCIRTESRFAAGNLANVEIVLPILGMILRMVGTIQWLTRDNLIGIRFFHASARSKNQLAALLTCLVDTSAAEEVKAAVAVAVMSEITDLDVELPELPPQISKLSPASIEHREHPEHHEPAPAKSPAEKVGYGSEDGVRLARDEEWPAALRLLKDNSQIAGAIVGLSLDGCSIRTAEPFKAGIQIRVEVDFQMRGLPFRLAGVTENVHERHIVDMRFLEMSARKRGELAEIIEELRGSGKPPSRAQ